MKKRIISSLVILCLVITTASLGSAASLDNTERAYTDIEQLDVNVIQPKSMYISTTYTALSIDNNIAECYAQINGYSGITTKIEIKMTLQKRFLLIWWNQVTWTKTIYSYKGSLLEDTSVGSGTFRVKADYTAYSGSSSETITAYSGIVEN